MIILIGFKLAKGILEFISKDHDLFNTCIKICFSTKQNHNRLRDGTYWNDGERLSVSASKVSTKRHI